jgi:hypothetical protein
MEAVAEFITLQYAGMLPPILPAFLLLALDLPPQHRKLLQLYWHFVVHQNQLNNPQIVKISQDTLGRL